MFDCVSQEWFSQEGISAMNPVIETHKLTKNYGKSRGIVDVDIIVDEGEIFGFIGPNGAGKSTTIRTLLSLVYKTSGEAKIFGLDCHKNREEILRNVGYLPSEIFYYDNMRALDLLNYSASFYHKDCSARITELADLLELDLSKKIEDMSLGNRKKVGIVQGLLHSPKLIILDEPTNGLDPLMQKTFFDLIQEENKKGATVLFSSHILDEVQRICDRVAIIKEGSIINTQKIAELREQSYKKVAFHAAQPIPQFEIEGGANVAINHDRVSFVFKGDVNALLHKLSQYRLINLDISEPSLEEIFMHYYR